MADQAERMNVVGLSGIHWRTFETSLTVSALAKAGWSSTSKAKLTVAGFYQEFASSAFGAQVGPEAAAILTSLDSFQPGFGQDRFPDTCKGGPTCPDACYSGGGGHCLRKQPPWDQSSFSCCAKWSSTPGQNGSLPMHYTYADVFAALRPRVPDEHLEVFDQWSGLLTYTQQLAATQEAVIRLKTELTLDAAKAATIAYSRMLTTLQEFTHTQGSLGLVTQHENMNYASNFEPPLMQLEEKLGRTLPTEILPSNVYTGTARLFCLTVRTLLMEDEKHLILPLIVQARAEDLPSTIVVFYRSLAAAAQKIEPQHLTFNRLSASRGWFNCTLPVEMVGSGGDFEWWAEATSLKLRYPRTAGNSVVVVVSKSS